MYVNNNSSDCNISYNDMIGGIRNDSAIMYFSNTMHINQFYGPLITKNPLAYNFTCEFNITMQTSLNFSLKPELSIIYIPASPENGVGAFTVTLAAYWDSNFNRPVQKDDQIYVGDNIYLGLFVQGLDGSYFVLTAENCFATPTSNRNDTNHAQLVQEGCAVSGDVQVVVLENAVSTEARIQFSSFLFQGLTEVYIFCDVKICTKDEGCGQCPKTGKALTNRVYSGLGIQLNLADIAGLTNSGYHTAVSWFMLVGSLLACLSTNLF
ncbi:uromodulin-like [Hyperolius riggenbachi]|uniref:uromodulin-like n=1 Tax=Hyperolius riggenbachi TaxID=752182 RepID=UPI0035A2E3B2